MYYYLKSTYPLCILIATLGDSASIPNRKKNTGKWQAVKPENDAYRPVLALTAAYFYSSPDFSYFSVM